MTADSSVHVGWGIKDFERPQQVKALQFLRKWIQRPYPTLEGISPDQVTLVGSLTPQDLQGHRSFFEKTRVCCDGGRLPNTPIRFPDNSHVKIYTRLRRFVELKCLESTTILRTSSLTARLEIYSHRIYTSTFPFQLHGPQKSIIPRQRQPSHP